MTFSKNTIAATVTTLLIVGLSNIPATAAVSDNEQGEKSDSRQSASDIATFQCETGRNEGSGDWITTQLLMRGW